MEKQVEKVEEKEKSQRRNTHMEQRHRISNPWYVTLDLGTYIS